MESVNALSLSHQFLSGLMQPGDLCIDATAGRGGDTAFLCRLVGQEGRVLAFDIQEEAVKSTRLRLEEMGLFDRAQVLLEGHEHMACYVEPGTVRAVTFNLGWLPGGDHTRFTRPETTLSALEQSLTLLCPDGVVSICIYYGRETGFAERDAVLEWLRQVDPCIASVLVSQFVNRPNCPAIAAFLLKGR